MGIWKLTNLNIDRFGKKAIKIGVKLVFLMFFLSGISCAHRVLIKTEPSGARVRIIAKNGRPAAPLGATPLDLKALPESDITLLEVEKEGHLPKLLVIPKMEGAVLTITTRLQPLSREFLAEKNRRDFAASLNTNLAQVFKLQALILSRKSDAVAKLEAQMREQWDDVSLFHSLMGNSFYLQGNFKEARKRYEKALALDPNNEEARTMLVNM